MSVLRVYNRLKTHLNQLDARLRCDEVESQSSSHIYHLAHSFSADMLWSSVVSFPNIGKLKRRSYRRIVGRCTPVEMMGSCTELSSYP